MYASLNGNNLDVVETLVEYNNSNSNFTAAELLLNAADPGGHTALHRACLHLRLGVIKSSMRQSGINFESRDGWLMRTPLNYVMWEKFEDPF